MVSDCTKTKGSFFLLVNELDAAFKTQIKTNFKNKKSAIETVTPMLDNDGEWRASGYYIK